MSEPEQCKSELKLGSLLLVCQRRKGHKGQHRNTEHGPKLGWSCRFKGEAMTTSTGESEDKPLFAVTKDDMQKFTDQIVGALATPTGESE